MGESDRLVWLDLEMSGLDPERERILEIAALITDGDLKVIAEGPDLVIRQPDEILQAMDEWNTKHHGSSGLTALVRQSGLSERSAEDQLLSFVREHCAERTAPLAGNSVHHDRRFLQRYMPLLDGWLHYRIVDVSTVKELARRWYPAQYAKRPSKRGLHRAMDDIRESVEELRYYRGQIFQPPPS